MAYTSFSNCTTQEYVEIIYSQDDKNKAKIWFNDVEYPDFNIKCEKITKTSRIMPNDGKKVLTLSNFVATELEVILHNVDLEDIQDQVKISIGTLVDAENDTYEYVPLGVFNIQDTPVKDNNKITLKLRDNRVKFDFNYNAKPLIDANGGSATKRQILEDICAQAGVQNDITSFEFEDDEIGVYDDSIKGTTYIAYLAEQCGCIPAINREGELIFIDLTNLYTWRIPLSLVSKPLTIGTPFTIQRVVYEQGIIKYESSGDETLETLYLNSSNPYIDRQEQIDYIMEILDGFTLDSVIAQKMLGNAAIDPYDLVEVYDDSDISEPTVFKTFANNVYAFNGVSRHSFQTEIGKEQRKENVTKKGDDASFRRWATTEINNLEGTVEIQTGRITSNEEEIAQLTQNFDNYATIDVVEDVQNSVTQLQTDTYTKTQIQQIANGTGVDGVKVTAVISTEATFDRDGMHYAKTDAPTNSTINEKGLKVNKSSGNNELLYAGYDDDSTSATYGNSIVRTDNLTVKTYLSCANGKGRIEQFTDSSNNTGVGFFLT